MKVKVEVVAERMTYSVENEDGTHTRTLYQRGDVFEMDEKDALDAAEGEIGGAPFVQRNSAGTEVWTYPSKTPGASRAAVKILTDKKTDVTPPRSQDVVKPAPAPKPAEGVRV